MIYTNTPKLFATPLFLSLLFMACASQPTHNEQTHLNVINWGNSYSHFWGKAQGQPFEIQMKIWDEIIESPHQKFYSQVVWGNVDSPNYLVRKTKRLAEIFKEYSKQASAIEANFRTFEATLAVQEKKFKITFPSARLKLPIMAVTAPTFNGKSDSYEDGGHIHFLAFGIDLLTIRGDNPDVLYTHELFHAYHSEVSAIQDDGAADDAVLLDSLWAEGLATFVSHELNPSASMQAVFLDGALANTSEEKLPYFARKFLEVKNERVHSKTHPEVYGHWFLMAKCPSNLSPCRAGYFLGYRVAKKLRQTYTLDQMAHWPFQVAHEKITLILQAFATLSVPENL